MAVLAACSGGSTESDDSSGADVVSPPASNVTTAQPEVSSSAPATSTAAGTSPASAPAGKSLVALDDLTVGSSKAVKLADGKPAIVTRTGTATAVCFSAICTHTGCTVKPKGGQFDCPCHGSTFDAKTGKVLGGPAPSPLPKIDVAVTGGAVTEA